MTSSSMMFVPVAIVGDEEGEVEQVVGEAGHAPADAQEQRAGLRGEEVGELGHGGRSGPPGAVTPPTGRDTR